MDLTAASTLVPRLEVVEASPSTNSELIERVASAPGSWPDASVLATDRQTGGHGRHGRPWSTPPGRCLAASVLLTPRAADGSSPAVDTLGWVPLMAGLAMTEAIRSLGVDTGLKWPNDVLAGEASARPGKLVGVLAELLPDARGVVVGTGVNLTLTEPELPVPTASSLALCGAASVTPDAVLTAYLSRLLPLYRDFVRAAGDAEACGLRAAVAEACSTIGRQVRVELPSGSVLTGRAAGIDASGRLEVDSASGRTAVSAGDVTHLRY